MAAGKHPQGDPHEDTAAPDPTKIAGEMTDAKDKAGGDVPTKAHDKTKKPVSEAVWTKARPAMHAIAAVGFMCRLLVVHGEEKLTNELGCRHLGEIWQCPEPNASVPALAASPYPCRCSTSNPVRNLPLNVVHGHEGHWICHWVWIIRGSRHPTRT